MKAGRVPVSLGMTLMETLVVVAIVGVLSLMLLESVRIVGLTYSSHVARDDDAIESASAVALLRDSLRFAHPAVRQRDDGGVQSLFEGAPRRLRFVVDSRVIAHAAPSIAIDGVGLVWMEAAWDAEQKALIFGLAPFINLKSTPPSIAEASNDRFRVLLREVEAFTLQYFGAREAGQELSWRNHWRLADGPPALVRVEVRRRGGEILGMTIAPLATPPTF
ncbi:MAG: prepilin-type N-terminal cleavage/methylation domain-containing protein [Rhodobacteraceae bacterium]|nr:prepilin-type N-terminal cleavage/methylation domain-containing protein [Paracoccaceae bacterium]